MITSKTGRSMKKMIGAAAAVVLLLTGVSLSMGQANADPLVPDRPEGPCDIYEAAGYPCVGTHSTTRALYASYDGPLYQVERLSDNKVKDIGIVASSVGDPGGYADAAAQDVFCADTSCLIKRIYDQSPMGNDLYQAPAGNWWGPNMGGADNFPVADRAPVMINGHKVYGTFIEPGMGLRNNDTKGVPVDDQAEGMYWIVNGKHYNSGCCYNYGNAEISSTPDGTGTMETTYFGNSRSWYYGQGNGPWLMSDQEDNIVGCVNSSTSNKVCTDLPAIKWRFVHGVAKGEPHHWATLGGDAQAGSMITLWDGVRISTSYDPMRKQGAIVLGNGGDNAVESQGTFYEAALAVGYPPDSVDQAIQQNIVAAKYQEYRLTFEPTGKEGASPGLMTFVPGASQKATVKWTNTTGERAAVVLSINSTAAYGVSPAAKTFLTGVAPGETVSQIFTITGGAIKNNVDLVANVDFLTASGSAAATDTALMKARNTDAIKINEISIMTSSNSTNTFIELYNAGATAVDMSNWTLTQRPTQQPYSPPIVIPAGTVLNAGGFYVLGLSTSGLAGPANAGDSAINVRSITGLANNQTIQIGTGATAETRTITSVGTASTNSKIWQPLPDGPYITVPAGSNNIPVQRTNGMTVGQKLMLGQGDTREVVTVTNIGRPGTQGRLSAAAAAGATNIKMSATTNITVGDVIRLDIDSPGHGIEYVTVTFVGTTGASGTGINIAEPLKYNHSSNLPYSVWGTGISFTPATKYAHVTNETVVALGSGLTLNAPLTYDHPFNDVVLNTAVTSAGFQ